MTVTGGVFLAASLIFAVTKTSVPIDPAWAAVIISGLPIGCIAIRDPFWERQISSELLITIAMVASIATPTSIMAAIGQATKLGVIIKSGDALERMGKGDTIAFDKTGTLTQGRLTVSDVVSFNTDI